VKISLVTFAVCLLSATAAFAQSPYGSVRGYVYDGQKAVLPGVRVTATAPDAPGVFTATSDADGLYRLIDLPPGTYTVTADLPNFAKFTREPVIVRAGLNVVLDVDMKLGGINETLDVRAEPPLLESKLPVQAVNISGDYQRNVPILPRRNWADFMLLTPGVSVGSNNVALFFWVHGVDFDEHVIQIDGADVASGLQNQLSYISLNPDALQDVEVKMAGVDASSQMGYGVAINAVTQSGTNRLKGSASQLFQPRGWNDQNVPGGTSTIGSTYETDLAVGGPIVRDRFWYFGTFRNYHQATGVSRTAAQVATLQALVPGFKPFDNVSGGNFYFGKATASLARGQRIEGFFERDKSPQDTAGVTSGAPVLKRVQGGNAASARLLSVWGNAITTRISGSYNDKSLPVLAYRTDIPSRNIYSGTVLSGGRLTGSGLLATVDNNSNSLDLPYRKFTVTGDATYIRHGLFGSHEFQAGGFWQSVHEELTLHYPDNGFSLEDDVLKDPNNPAAGVMPFHRQIFDVASVTSTLGRSRDAAVYAQDVWQPFERLTANIGLRVEMVNRKDLLLNVTGENATQLAPRLGATYLLTKDGRNTIRATFARLPEVMAAGSSSVGATAAGFKDTYDLNNSGSFTTVFATPASSAVAADRVIDPGFHQPYVNETSVGYRRQLPSLVSLDVTYIYRETKDRPVLIDTNGMYAGGVFRGYSNPAFNQIYLVTNNRWNWLVYSGLDISVARQGERVQWLASYNHQWRHVAGTWVPNDPASFIQPGAFANDKGIGNTRAPLTVPVESNSLSGTYMAGSGQWRENVVSLSGSVRAPWDLRIAPVITYQSGPWSGPVVSRLAAPDPGFGPTTVVLSNGRVVPNPLATTIRFAYPTRSDGQFALKRMYSVNVQVSREFTFGPRRLSASLALYNLTNYDAPLQFAAGANQQYSATYQQGIIVQQPRAAQGVVRFFF
jgi:carboxypeptidase family protein